MDLKIIRNKLVGDDQERAVSPVIGVILMVAITVILAAVIAAFVLDMGPGESATPSTQASADGDTSWNMSDGEDQAVFATVSQGGGDAIDHDELVVDVHIEGDFGGAVDGQSWTDNATTLNANNNFEDNDIVLNVDGDEFSVGNSYDLEIDDGVTYNTTDDGVTDGTAEITIIHEPSNTIVDETTVELNDWVVE